MPFICSNTDSLAVLNLVGDAAKVAHICSSYDVSTLGAPAAVSRYIAQRLQENADSISDTKSALDITFLLTAAYQVFVMQAGFALYAAGVIRAKNVVNILSKNFMDACVGAVMFYLVGYAFAFGEGQLTNGFVGFWEFGLNGYENLPPSQAAWHLFLWNWAFCSAAATVLSGAVAERATFVAYLLYSAFISSWVYPVVAHWLWARSGWLNPNYVHGPLFKAGCIDFAGSGVVHTLAGTASLIGAWMVGPRYGRFERGADPDMFRGISPANYVLGTFLLWFGWFGFNPASLQRVSTSVDAHIVARTAVNTMLSAGFGAVTIIFLTFYRTRKWSLLDACSGALCGLVAITSGCSVVEPWAAAICGMLTAPIYTYSELWEVRMKIDDPVSAFPMHGVCGMFGVLFVGFFARKRHIEDVYQRPVFEGRYGVLYGGDGYQLLCQLIGVAAIAGWTAVHMLAFFWLLKRFNILRVKVEEEVVGLDVAAHGALPHPEVVNPYADGLAGYNGAGAMRQRSLAHGAGNFAMPGVQLGRAGSSYKMQPGPLPVYDDAYGGKVAGSGYTYHNGSFGQQGQTNWDQQAKKSDWRPQQQQAGGRPWSDGSEGGWPQQQAPPKGQPPGTWQQPQTQGGWQQPPAEPSGAWEQQNHGNWDQPVKGGRRY